MARTIISSAALLLLALTSSASFADEGIKMSTGANMSALLACRAIADVPQRLACFDTESAKLVTALDQKDVVVVSRNDVKAAQKSVFGLNLPALGLLGSKSDAAASAASEEEGIAYIETRLAAARQGPDGKWVFVLEDGARWAQSDTGTIRLPKPGDVIRIRRAALGSFMANINGRPAIRVRRLS